MIDHWTFFHKSKLYPRFQIVNLFINRNLLQKYLVLAEFHLGKNGTSGMIVVRGFSLKSWLV